MLIKADQLQEVIARRLLMAGSVSPTARPEADIRQLVSTRNALSNRKRIDANEAHLDGPSTRWETIMGSVANTAHREPWNKGKIVGQRACAPQKLDSARPELVTRLLAGFGIISA
jgi:hypothetical protein